MTRRLLPVGLLWLGAAGCGGAVREDGEPDASCTPEDRSGVYAARFERIIGRCEPAALEFVGELYRPPAPPTCELDLLEYSETGCSHRTRCWFPSGTGFELSVMQLDPAGELVRGRLYWHSTEALADRGLCQWLYEGARLR